MSDELKTIDAAVLEHVTGGRYTAGPSVPTERMIQAVDQLGKLVGAGLQQIASVRQQSEASKMQIVQQVMQQKLGGGAPGGRPA